LRETFIDLDAVAASDWYGLDRSPSLRYPSLSPDPFWVALILQYRGAGRPYRWFLCGYFEADQAFAQGLIALLSPAWRQYIQAPELTVASLAQRDGRLDRMPESIRTAATIAAGVKAPPAPAVQPDGGHEAGPPQQTPPSRTHRRKGGAKDPLSAALDSLADKGDWGKPDAQIISLAGISCDLFYRLKK
jgi:hypothetical protein